VLLPWGGSEGEQPIARCHVSSCVLCRLCCQGCEGLCWLDFQHREDTGSMLSQGEHEGQAEVYPRLSIWWCSRAAGPTRPTEPAASIPTTTKEWSDVVQCRGESISASVQRVTL
jgi:hypothetical protein